MAVACACPSGVDGSARSTAASAARLVSSPGTAARPPPSQASRPRNSRRDVSPRTQASTSSDSPEQKAATKKFTDCIGVDESVLDDDVSGDEAKAKSDKFSQGKDLDFDMRASVGESSEKQQTVLDTFQKPEVTGCFGDFFTEAITFSIEHPDNGQALPAGVSIGKVEVEKVDLKLDAESVTYRATIPVMVQ